MKVGAQKSAEGDWAWGKENSATNSESCLILSHKKPRGRLTIAVFN